MHPLAAALDLSNDTDKVYIGDSGLSREVLSQFSFYIKEETLKLRVKAFDNQIKYVLGAHINRQDEARDVIRSAEARIQKNPECRAAIG